MGSPQVPTVVHRLLAPRVAWGAAGVVLALIGLHLMHAGGAPLPSIAVLLLGCAQAVFGLSASCSGPVARQALRLSERCAGWLGVRPAQLLLIANGLILSLAARTASGDAALNASPLATPLWLTGIVLVCAGCWARNPAPTTRAGRGERSRSSPF